MKISKIFFVLGFVICISCKGHLYLKNNGIPINLLESIEITEELLQEEIIYSETDSGRVILNLNLCGYVTNLPNKISPKKDSTFVTILTPVAMFLYNLNRKYKTSEINAHHISFTGAERQIDQNIKSLVKNRIKIDYNPIYQDQWGILRMFTILYWRNYENVNSSESIRKFNSRYEVIVADKGVNFEKRDSIREKLSSITGLFDRKDFFLEDFDCFGEKKLIKESVFLYRKNLDTEMDIEMNECQFHKKKINRFIQSTLQLKN